MVEGYWLAFMVLRFWTDVLGCRVARPHRQSVAAGSWLVQSMLGVPFFLLQSSAQPLSTSFTPLSASTSESASEDAGP